MSFKWFASLIVTTIAAGVGFATIAFATGGTQETEAISETPTQTAQETKTPDFALERARREVRLLDDMYKTSIVLITEHYVNTADDLPAGEAFTLLFAKMEVGRANQRRQRT